jgi:RNA polymerase sigma factor (sigma-70 family)
MPFTPAAITNLKAKDHHTFSLLYDAYSVNLYNRILRKIPDEAAAADILQDTFVKIYRKIESYDPAKGTLYTWMVTIALRTCLDYIDRMNTPRSLDEVQTSKYYSVPDLREVGIAAFVQTLEKKVKDVIVLCYYRGYTCEEAAVLLQIPEGTVKSRRRSGLIKLRQKLIY